MRADLEDAWLNGAILQGADLRKASLVNADLWAANLSDADLRDVNLRGRRMETATFVGALANMGTRWPDGFDPVVAGVRFETE